MHREAFRGRSHETSRRKFRTCRFPLTMGTQFWSYNGCPAIKIRTACCYRLRLSLCRWPSHQPLSSHAYLHRSGSLTTCTSLSDETIWHRYVCQRLQAAGSNKDDVLSWRNPAAPLRSIQVRGASECRFSETSSDRIYTSYHQRRHLLDQAGEPGYDSSSACHKTKARTDGHSGFDRAEARPSTSH